MRDVFYSDTTAKWNALLKGPGNESLNGAQLYAVAAILASGSCGTAHAWKLDETGTLTIEGYGAMEDYYDYEHNLGDFAPWNNWRDSIIRVVFTGNVQTIGRSAFWNCSNLVSVVLPEELEINPQKSKITCTFELVNKKACDEIYNKITELCDPDSITLQELND